MEEFRAQGKTMLIISHDLQTIQSISDRILLLDEGSVVGLGDPEEWVGRYQWLTRTRNAAAMTREWGTGEVRITGVEFTDASGQPCQTFRSGGALQAQIRYCAHGPHDNPVFGFALSDESGRLIYGNNTQIEGCRIERIEGEGTVTLRIHELRMAAGTYLFSFSVHSADHRTNYHRLDNRFPIAVESDRPFEGCCYMPIVWSRT